MRAKRVLTPRLALFALVGSATSFALLVAALGLGSASAEPLSGHASVSSFQLAVVVGTAPHQHIALFRVRGGVGTISKRYAIGDGIRALSWKPGAAQLAVVTAGSNVGNAIVLLDLASGKKDVLAGSRRKASAAFFGEVAWSPKSKLLAVTRAAGTYGARLELLDGRSGKLVKSFRASARLDSRISWSSDGKAVVFAQQPRSEAPSRLRRLLISSGEIRQIGESGQDPALNAQATLAFSMRDGIRLSAPAGDRHLRGSKPGDRRPAWSASGTAIVFERPSGVCPRSYTPNVCTHVFVVPATGGAARQVFQAPARAPVAR